MSAKQDIERCSGKRAEPGRKGAPSKGEAGGAAEVPLGGPATSTAAAAEKAAPPQRTSSAMKKTGVGFCCGGT